MDERAFDDLTKSLATGVSRRRALRALLAGAAAVGGALGLDRAAAACTGYLKRCTTSAQCCTGYCSPSKRCLCPPGHRRCLGVCRDIKNDVDHCGGCFNDCTEPGATCVDGVCNPPNPPPCPVEGGAGPAKSTAAGCNCITFTWSPVPGATTYRIEIDGVERFNGSGTTYTDCTNVPRKAVGTYQDCFFAGDGTCEADPVCGSFNTRGCPAP